MDNSDGKGGFKDWMQSRSGAVPGVTLEVGKTPCPVPFAEFPEVWRQNKGSLGTGSRLRCVVRIPDLGFSKAVPDNFVFQNPNTDNISAL